MIGTRRAGALGLAQATGHLEAVEVGQHHVEDDQVGAAGLGRGQGAPPGGRPFDLEAVEAEAHGHHLGDVLFVVDDQDPGLPPLVAHVLSLFQGFPQLSPRPGTDTGPMSDAPSELQLSIRRLVDFLAGPFSEQRLETPGGGQVFCFAQGSAAMEAQLGGDPRPGP